MATPGPLAMGVVIPILLTFEACVFIALPFGNVNELRAFKYWVLVIALATTVLPYVCFVIGLAIARKGAFVGALALFVIAIAWRFVELIYPLSIVLATCEGDLYCADNELCDGTLTGPYTGPTVRFIIIFVMCPVSIVIDFIALFMSWSCFSTLRRVAYMNLEALGATVAMRSVSERTVATRTARNVEYQTQQQRTMEEPVDAEFNSGETAYPMADASSSDEEKEEEEAGDVKTTHDFYTNRKRAATKDS